MIKVTHHRPHRVRFTAVTVAVSAAVIGQAAASSPVTADQRSSSALSGRSLSRLAAPQRDDLARPALVLGPGWRRSRDVTLAVAGDAAGLHVLAARASQGYAWRTVAMLGVRGTDTSQWIGQACLAGGGKRAVVVYAPRQITNTPDALGYGALAAVVNLSTGKVTPLGPGASIAYFDPGCGTGQDAVLTQGGTGASPLRGPQFTRLMMLDTATGKITSMVKVPGQVTSAVPWDGRIAAVDANRVVSIGPGGSVTVLAAPDGRPYQLVPDAAGGLGFQVAAGKAERVERWAAGRAQLVGTVPLGTEELAQVGGRVFVTGKRSARLAPLPAGWRALDVPAGAEVSSTGKLAVTLATTGLYAKGTSPLAAAPDQPQPARVTAIAAPSGRQVSFRVPAAGFPAAEPARPQALPGYLAAVRAAVPAQSVPPAAPMPGPRIVPKVSPPSSTANPATTTYDPDRSCSVPRNYLGAQTYQPSAQQIEWAADQAVQNNLTDTQPVNLYGSGLPSYTPQGMFPAPGLKGGGLVPAQVMLGILAQESNEDQASNHAIIGQTGNFMPSFNWYGDGGNYTFVNWSQSDCGYGIAQITSRMCLSGFSGCSNPFPYNDQLAIAIDYQANIAAGLQILEQKWNELYNLGILANGGDPKYIEDWWFALWDYNSGLEPNAANGNTTGCSPSPSCTDSLGMWGLGWVNNPANPMYPLDRPMFGAQGPSGTVYSYNWDTVHPGNWSYEEKVVGFGAYGFIGYSFINATWGQTFARTHYPANSTPPLAQPSLNTFCTSTNKCTPSSGTTPATCQLMDSHCWWHSAVTWESSCSLCGTQTLTYAAGAADPGDPGVPSGYGPVCSNSPLPSSAVIVGDSLSHVPSPLGCGPMWNTNGGTMTWGFAADTSTTPATYPSKIDFHQIGDGYGGHFWFTHTIPSNQSQPIPPISVTPSTSVANLQITGTWKPPTTVTGWQRILVSIPNEGAWDPQANYQIHLGNGTTDRRIVNQAYQATTWVDLGLFNLSSGASVSLNNVTFSGLSRDIAWGAVAFVPAVAPTTSYVALGDSYSSGEGVQPYDMNSDYNSPGMADACHRSTNVYSRLVKLPNHTNSIATSAKTLTGSTEYSFIACSGAHMTGITQNAEDSPPSAYDTNGNTDWGTIQFGFNEIPQADTGWLSSKTTLVTLTIGGNDARFTDVLAGCLLTLTDCTDSSYYLTRASTGAVDPQPLIDFEPTVINTLLPTHLQNVYTTIHQEAPNAEIIVIGYPPLFPANAQVSCPVGLGAEVNAADQNWMNKMAGDLDTAIGNSVSAVAATGVNIKFINPTVGFTGHDVCSSAPWVNGLIAWSVSGSGLKYPGSGSFHPMLAGQQEYATLVDECLAGTLPSAQGTC